MFGSVISKLLVPICIVAAAGYWVLGPYSPLPKPQNPGPSKVDLWTPEVHPSAPHRVKHVVSHATRAGSAQTPVFDVVAGSNHETANRTQNARSSADSDSVAIASPAPR